MSKTGLWSREKPRPTDSNAELRLCEELAGDLPVRDGRWFQNSKLFDHSLREQAHSFAKKLVSRLPSVNGMIVPYGILSIFPDTPSSDAPVQDNLRDLIYRTGQMNEYLSAGLTSSQVGVF